VQDSAIVRAGEVVLGIERRLLTSTGTETSGS
jgi:hypothetical protein